ncbi:MAG: zinc ribbon domain-containing protein [Pyrinomonadaceae bacterium]
MFCPKCATQNLEGAKFCRSCGTDISLVPQVLTGQLAARLSAAEDSLHGRRRSRRERRDGPASIERAVKNLFMGVAFIFIAFAVKTWAPAGHIWWFWMFLPAAAMLADGVATYLRLAAEGRHPMAHAETPPQPFFAPAPPRSAGSLSQADTGEMIPPPSVTEGTTRHLAVPAERERRDR